MAADDGRWDLIAAERLALADLLETLTEEQWAMPTLCEAWTVKDMAAHVMVGPTSSMPEVLVQLVLARLNLSRAIERMTAARSRQSPEQLVATIRDHADSRFSPPSMDWHAPLTEILVHREDIVVPLGLPSDRPVAPWGHALSFLVTDQAQRSFVKGPLPEVRLVATDLDWSHGSGPEVRGPAAALGPAMTRRPAVLDRLSGPALATFSAWVRR